MAFENLTKEALEELMRQRNIPLPSQERWISEAWGDRENWEAHGSPSTIPDEWLKDAMRRDASRAGIQPPRIAPEYDLNIPTEPEQPTQPSGAEPIGISEPISVGEVDGGFRPDFTKSDPYENAPPEYFEQVKEGFVPTEETPAPPGAVVVGWMADGSPSVAEYHGEKYFLPGSTPYEMGFRTASEQGQFSGEGFGVGSGKGIPSDTVILLDETGKPVRRYSFDQIAKGITPINQDALPQLPTSPQGKYLRDDGTWVSGTGGASWGSITGTLTEQTDLSGALNGKEPAGTAAATASRPET